MREGGDQRLAMPVIGAQDLAPLHGGGRNGAIDLAAGRCLFVDECDGASRRGGFGSGYKTCGSAADYDDVVPAGKRHGIAFCISVLGATETTRAPCCRSIFMPLRAGIMQLC